MASASLLSVSVALILGTFLAGCRPLEESFVYPGAASQGKPYAVLPPSPDYELLSLTTRDGTPFVAQFGGPIDAAGHPLARPDPAPTAIFFYGNGAYAAGMASEFWNLRRLGANALLVEYPGYGMSGGRPSEPAFYAAAEAALDCLERRSDVDRNRMVAVGWSMGGAVAVDLAARHRVSGLVVINAFTSLQATARALQPWLPTSLVLKSRFDNLSKIGTVTCPILIIHGDRDEVVPPRMSGELQAAARAPVRSLTVAGAGHNDIFERGGDALWAAIGATLGPSAQPPPAAP
jgi:fermentation-respiration switch protein FrsA (DUF1100 family)